MKENLSSQKGLTLIEVLVSIVLLGFILTSFFGFFTQSALFTQKNYKKLDTSQTAQMVINTIENEVSKELLGQKNITNNGNIINSNLQIPDSGGKLIPAYKINNIADINSKLNLNINTDYSVSAIISNQPTNDFIQFKITVEDPETGNKSDTYTYIRKVR